MNTTLKDDFVTQVNIVFEVNLHSFCEVSFFVFFGQVILIGDAPPNTPDEVTYKRHWGGGEKFWSSTNFARPTHWETEVAILKQKDIPIHAFYVHRYAKTAFEAIARVTAKAGHTPISEYLDTRSAAATQRLRSLIGERVAFDVGNNSGRAGGGQSVLETFRRLQGQGNL